MWLGLVMQLVGLAICTVRNVTVVQVARV